MSSAPVRSRREARRELLGLHKSGTEGQPTNQTNGREAH